MLNRDKFPIRKTIDIDKTLDDTIKEMAEKRNWSFSYMSCVLLQQAVKEKARKSTAKK